jgi:NAD(P)-dependent dehydrogenase (short-subunit alcohol dehydrogenase family)
MDKYDDFLYTVDMHTDEAQKTIVVTGASSGMGLEIARELAERGHLVIGIGRSRERCDRARTEITGGNRERDKLLQFILVDLSLLQSVREGAGAIHGELQNRGFERLDVLINNAAAVSSRRTETAEGNELQWTVNHLAPFLLTHQLFPLLQRSGDARVITVSSASHQGGRVKWKDPQLRRGYNTLRAYKQSKLANILFTYQLNRLMGPGAPVKAFAVNPGLVRTEIGHKNTNGLAYWLWTQRQRKAVSPAEGASTSVYLADAPAESLQGGAYWRNCRPVNSSRYSYRVGAAEKLWSISEQMCGVSYGEYL